MSFPPSFVHPPEFYPFFPAPPPPLMPWNFPPMTLPFPIPPHYPMQNQTLYPPQHPSNLMISEQHNHFYGANPQLPHLTRCTNPYFQKLAEPPKPVPQNHATKHSNKKEQVPTQKQKVREVIEISDEAPANKKNTNNKPKKQLVSKQKRLIVELKRLNNKKFSQLLDQDSENLEKSLKNIVEHYKDQPKRITRVSGRIPKQYKQIIGKYDLLDYQPRKRAPKKQISESIPQDEEQNRQDQNMELFKDFRFETSLPQLLTPQQLKNEKAALKEALILRSMSKLDLT